MAELGHGAVLQLTPDQQLADFGPERFDFDKDRIRTITLYCVANILPLLTSDDDSPKTERLPAPALSAETGINAVAINGAFNDLHDSGLIELHRGGGKRSSPVQDAKLTAEGHEWLEALDQNNPDETRRIEAFLLAFKRQTIMWVCHDVNAMRAEVGYRPLRFDDLQSMTTHAALKQYLGWVYEMQAVTLKTVDQYALAA